MYAGCRGILYSKTTVNPPEIPSNTRFWSSIWSPQGTFWGGPKDLTNGPGLESIFELFISHFTTHLDDKYIHFLNSKIQKFKNSKIQNSKFKIQNSKFKIRNPKSEIRNSKFEIRNSKFEIRK